MSNSTARLRDKIRGARELQGVVSAMKALAASSIGQYERSVAALGDYSHALELALGVCLRAGGYSLAAARRVGAGAHADARAVIFGSDQGLVGQFNEVVAAYAVKSLAAHGGKSEVWAVGERAEARLEEAGLRSQRSFPVPGSVKGIVPLVGQILAATETSHGWAGTDDLWLFHNRPSKGAAFTPVGQRLLPLDEIWARRMAGIPWPTKLPPQTLGDASTVFRQLIRGHLFVSLFRACAESLASENASRLAAMQRADKNIKDRLEELQARFHRMRQSGIDEELFDVISGFEALSKEPQ
jgi:F-type H+-transporting ATPase subunit gamma